MSERAPVLEKRKKVIPKFTKGVGKAALLREKHASERAPITTHGKPEKESRAKTERLEAQHGFIDSMVLKLVTSVDMAMDATERGVFVSHDETGNEVTGIVEAEYDPLVRIGTKKGGMVIKYRRPRDESRDEQETTFVLGEEGTFTVGQSGKPDDGGKNPFEEAKANYEGGLIGDSSVFDESELQRVSNIVNNAVMGAEAVLQADAAESQKPLEERGLPIY